MAVQYAPIDLFEQPYEVHSAAALFPMIPPDELEELARDIAANGLIHPIVLDKEGRVLDGRNRLAACELVGVDPEFVTYEGDDPEGYVLSANVNRRNLSKGQRAMAVAILNESLEIKDSLLAIETQVNPGYLSMARRIRQYAPELCDAVMAGDVSLNDAYEEAKANKQRTETSQERAARAAKDMENLRANAPDFADMVIEGRMTIPEALAAWKERERFQRGIRELATHGFTEAMVKLWGITRGDPDKITEQWIDGISESRRQGEVFAHLWTGDGIRIVARMLDAIAEQIDRRGELR